MSRLQPILGPSQVYHTPALFIRLVFTVTLDSNMADEKILLGSSDRVHPDTGMSADEKAAQETTRSRIAKLGAFLRVT